MNKCTIAEAFGEQLEAVTTGTPYAVDTDSDNFISELEQRIRKVMFSLWMDAQSNKLANSLYKKQAAHFDQLYEFSYGVPIYDQDVSISRDAESLALGIIDEKNSYMKRIEHLRSHYERFNCIVDDLDESSKIILVSYFKFNQKVDYETLRNVLSKNLKAIEKIYKRDELEREVEAERLEDEYQDKIGKQKYLINRHHVYMSPYEYKAYLEKQKQEREKMYERLGINL